jgi:NTP pyrophosphatase (non-canonical NTP hydrolase)
MIDIIDFELLKRVVKKSNEENGAPYGHAMEELAELQIECSKRARGKDNHEQLKGESGDVFFKLLRILDYNDWDLNDLIKDCLDKTRERFPHQLDTK